MGTETDKRENRSTDECDMFMHLKLSAGGTSVLAPGVKFNHMHFKHQDTNYFKQTLNKITCIKTATKWRQNTSYAKTAIPVN